MKEDKVPGVLIAFGKGKPAAGDDEDTAEESAGELAAKAFFKAGAAKDWAGAFEAFQSLVDECDDSHAEPAEDDEDSEEE